MQLRSERREANLFNFKEDIAPLLIFLNLLGQLKVDNLSGGKAIAILFRFIGSKYVPKLVIAAPTNYSRILLSTSARQFSSPASFV
ncbi:MAG: hypothetical protein VX893_09715 [Candidatus Latescibacterota bacterium]|nr:hypothetical protein [Candidatus Latescibacterota bacterium]